LDDVDEVPNYRNDVIYKLKTSCKTTEPSRLQNIHNVPRRICISIRLGKKLEPSPLPKLELDCAAPTGTAPKLVPG